MHLLLLISLVLQMIAPAAIPHLEVTRNIATIDFPNAITFSIQAEADQEITALEFHYGTGEDTCGEVEAIAYPDFTPGQMVSANWVWNMRQSGSLPPGAEVWWEWQITTIDGKQLITQRKTITWLDAIHDWQTIQEGLIRLHSYSLDQNQSKILLESAMAALIRLSDQTGMTAKEPIDIYIYADSNEMRDAILYEAGWTGGLAYAGYNIVLIGISPDQIEWGKRTIAHEITHVLVGDYSFSCLGSLPTWLSEGLAMVGEGGPDSTAQKGFEAAIQEDTLFPFRILSGGFSENPDKADLSYVQSYHMVEYLLQEAGNNQMNQFLTILAQGIPVEQAFKQIYGMDLDSFEADWRKELGAKSAPISSDKGIMLTPTFIPTIPPVSPRAMISTPIPTQHSITPTPIDLPEERNTSLTVLGILMLCCGAAGVLIAAGLSFLIARDRGKKRNLLTALGIGLTAGGLLLFTNQIVYSQSTSATPFPMLQTATAYQPAETKLGVYRNEALGFELEIPRSVKTIRPEGIGSTLLTFQIDQNTILGELYHAPGDSRLTLEQTASEFSESSFAGLSDVVFRENKAISLPSGIEAWYSLADAELTAYQQPIRIGQLIIRHQGEVITLQMYGDPSNYTSYQKTIQQLFNSKKTFQPIMYGYPRDQVLILAGGESSNPRENDPATAHGTGDMLVFSGLVQNSPALIPVPDLAMGWTISTDEMTYTFTIHPDARFHNGRPVTAQDVVYSWERALDDQTASDVALTYLGDIDGALELHAGTADHLRGLTILDNKTLQVKLTAPRQTFLQKLTFPTTFIVDHENIAQGADWYLTPNGTGPFQLVRWQSMQAKVYERFSDYYGEKPALRAVYASLFSGESIRLYESNAIDIAPVGSFNVARFQNPLEPMHTELKEVVNLCTHYITFDLSQPPFDDLLVRKAFSAAVDKDQYVQVVYSGAAIAAKGLFPPALPGFDLNTTGITYNPEQAKQWLAESSYPLTQMPEIVFTTSGYGSSVSNSISAWVQMWEQNLGVKIKVQNIEPEKYQQSILNGSHGQLVSQGWCADYPDPENFTSPLFSSQSALNIGNYHNPILDALLEKASTESDPGKRIPMYKQAEQLILADAPAVFTTHSISYTLVKPFVKGYPNAPIAIPVEKYISIDPSHLE